WSQPGQDGREVRGLAVSPNGATVYSGGQDGSLKVWDARTGAAVRTLGQDLGSIESMSLARDGSKLIVGQGGAVAIWPIASQRPATTKGANAKKSAARPGAAKAARPAETRPRPKAAQKFNGHSYAVITEPATWHGARRRCEEMGGHLATPETPAERDFLLKLVRDAKTSAWFGATDEEVEGEWVWVTGKPVTKAQQEGW